MSHLSASFSARRGSSLEHPRECSCTKRALTPLLPAVPRGLFSSADPSSRGGLSGVIDSGRPPLLPHRALSDASSSGNSQDPNQPPKGRRMSRRKKDPNGKEGEKKGISGIEVPVAFVAAQGAREIAAISAEVAISAAQAASSAAKAGLGEFAESTIRDSVTQAALGTRTSASASTAAAAQSAASKAMMGINPTANVNPAAKLGSAGMSAGNGLVAAAAVAFGIAGASSLINKAAQSGALPIPGQAQGGAGSGVGGAATGEEDPLARVVRDLKAGDEGTGQPWVENECPTCNSFGIVRCDLCRGQGVVTWEAKFDHDDPCPKCLTKRYILCPTCRGTSAKGRKHYLFRHLQGFLGRKEEEDDNLSD